MAMGGETGTAPAWGTRPRNRRELIIAAATELFLTDGYERVSMSAVADAVNVRPSALYRHFSSKADLLTAAVIDEMEQVRGWLADVPDDLDAVAERLAVIAQNRKQLGTLWQREARGLPREEFSALRAAVSRTVDVFAEQVMAHRPELDSWSARLLASCTYSAVCGLSRLTGELPANRARTVFTDIMRTILNAHPVSGGEPDVVPPDQPGLSPVGRRERLLAAAIDLFAEYGYTAVAMEDIGRQAGIAAPTVYHHFESKQHLLLTAMARVDEWLRHGLYWALRSSQSPAEGLVRLVKSYIDFAVRHPQHVDVLLSEARHLGNAERAQTAQLQSEYIQEWVHLMLSASPGRTEAELALRVYAILAIGHDVARISEFRHNPDVIATVKRFASALALPENPSH
jgi:AcrR family transcriptional regulator